MPGAAQDKRLSAEREALRRLESERREEREGEGEDRSIGMLYIAEKWG